jgi:DNA-binding MarR family transcriptional regulator
MNTLHPSLAFFLHLAKIQAVLTRRFDANLSGLSLSEFMILSQLHEAVGERIRRVDLAERIGLTASGITRLLAPMEKIGLVDRETDPRDARVSYVVLASGGRKKFSDALERAECLAEELIPSAKRRKLEELSDLLESIPGIR